MGSEMCIRDSFQAGRGAATPTPSSEAHVRSLPTTALLGTHHMLPNGWWAPPVQPGRLLLARPLHSSHALLRRATGSQSIPRGILAGVSPVPTAITTIPSDYHTGCWSIDRSEQPLLGLLMNSSKSLMEHSSFIVA